MMVSKMSECDTKAGNQEFKSLNVIENGEKLENFTHFSLDKTHKTVFTL